MNLPQEVKLTFEPVDDGSIYNLEIETEYEADRWEILKLLTEAYTQYLESMKQEGLIEFDEEG